MPLKICGTRLTARNCSKRNSMWGCISGKRRH